MWSLKFYRCTSLHLLRRFNSNSPKSKLHLELFKLKFYRTLNIFETFEYFQRSSQTELLLISLKTLWPVFNSRTILKNLSF